MSLSPTTSLTDAQVRQLHALYRNEWWTRDRTLDEVRRMLAQSDYVFGLTEPGSGALVAFARVLTDRVFKAFVFDVIVAPAHRGRKAGRAIVDAVLEHPDLAAVRHWELYCLPEMVSFYRQWGFSADVGGVVLLRRQGGADGPPDAGGVPADTATGLEIRVATPRDAADVARLVAAFRDHLRAATPSDAMIECELARALTEPSLEFSCARLDGEAVGYTQACYFHSVWAGGPEARLEDLFVIAGARRRQVGRLLLRHALARARARGARRFVLATNERNALAQELYRSEGLTPMAHALYPGGREILWGRDLVVA
jgi:ribosomal protein S18 acetylase RimI-like enzyme